MLYNFKNWFLLSNSKPTQFGSNTIFNKYHVVFYNIKQTFQSLAEVLSSIHVLS
jgi:hypothetical protein